MSDTSTLELLRIGGDPVRCCHPECEQPASFAHAALVTYDNLRLYEMQPYCVQHWLQQRMHQRAAEEAGR